MNLFRWVLFVFLGAFQVRALALDPQATPVTAAAVVAVRAYEAKLAAPAKEFFIGFRAALVSADRVEVAAFGLRGPQELLINKYECATVAPPTCVDQGPSGAFAYQPGSRSFSPREFEQGVSAALDLFLAKVGSTALIVETKVWQTNGHLEFAFVHRAGDGTPKTVYMMCHYHEPGELDCHKQSRAGQNEPRG